MVAFADSTCILNGRVDELALYKRLLTAGERDWLHHNGQGRACTGITCLSPSGGAAPLYTLTDHLGSTNISVDASGAKIAERLHLSYNALTFDTTHWQ